jgi:hypothetical protein
MLSPILLFALWLVSLFVSLPIARAEQPPWYSHDLRSKMDDSSGFIAAIASDDEAGEFTIRCLEGRTDAYVRLLKTYPTFDSSGAIVTYRVDSQKPVTTRWSASADSRAIFSNDPIIFLKTLPGTGRLLIRIDDYRRASHDYEFNYKGLDTYRSKVAAACKW